MMDEFLLEQAKHNATVTITTLVDVLNDEFIATQKHQAAFYLLKRMLADEYLRDSDKAATETLAALDASIGMDGETRGEVAETWRSRSAAWVTIAICQLDPIRRACLSEIKDATTVDDAWSAVHRADHAMRQAVERAK